MTYLIMKDGTRKEIGYNQGAKIHQILLGNKKAETQQQAAFVKLVDSVLFNATELKAKIVNPVLSKDYGSGYKKFLAMGEYLKTKKNNV